MPDDSHLVMYHVQFADADFATAGHEMNILEMLSLMACQSTSLSPSPTRCS